MAGVLLGITTGQKKADEIRRAKKREGGGLIFIRGTVMVMVTVTVDNDKYLLPNKTVMIMIRDPYIRPSNM